MIIICFFIFQYHLYLIEITDMLVDERYQDEITVKLYL